MKLGKIQLNLTIEGEIVSEYISIENTRMFVIQLTIHLKKPKHEWNKMMFINLIPGISMTMVDKDGILKGVYTTIVLADELVYHNQRYFGGILDIPKDVQDEWDKKIGD